MIIIVQLTRAYSWYSPIIIYELHRYTYIPSKYTVCLVTYGYGIYWLSYNKYYYNIEMFNISVVIAIIGYEYQHLFFDLDALS